MSARRAFFEVCNDAEIAKSSYVSLYVTEPYFGGPEEGGWWGRDVKLVAYQQCTNEVEARVIEAEVDKLAEKLSEQAKDDFNRQCQAECEWLEARGLDDDFLPEVNGEHSYWVAVESKPGSLASEGTRQYS